MAEHETWRKAARSRYWREEDAREVVSAWRRSGPTAPAFCRIHGLLLTRLYRWNDRLERDRSVAAEPVVRDAIKFHPVRLNDVGAIQTLEIELPGGATVRLPAGFAVDDLRRILSAFASPTEC